MADSEDHQRSPAERPIEWRRRKAEQLTKTIERRNFPASDLEMRERQDGTLTLRGYASITESPYEVGFFQETIKRGAFKRTLGENPDVQLLINHGEGGSGMPLARTRSGTLRLEEDERGLKVEADLDPEDPDVQSLSRKMRRGDIDMMSFAFQATDQDWNEEHTERSIKAVSIHRGDVSVVNQAANPAAGASLRSREAAEALRGLSERELVDALLEWRDRSLVPVEQREDLSPGAMGVWSQLSALVAPEPDAIAPLMTEFMGVPTPEARTVTPASETREPKRLSPAERQHIHVVQQEQRRRLKLIRGAK